MARFYVLPSTHGLWTHCHLCGWSEPFTTFLKQIDPALYREYSLEKFKSNRQRNETPLEPLRKPVQKVFEMPLQGLQAVTETRQNHPARLLLAKRAIPVERWADLWHCDDFQGFTNSLVPDTYDKYTPEPRLVIPFRDRTGKFIGCQGRSYNSASRAKYLTVVADEDAPFLFGYERVTSGRRFVTEGPFDSMFVRNGCSAAGDVRGELLKINSDPSEFVVVYDNEPRSRQTVQKIERAIYAGFPVVIWPQNVTEKDINEMVLARLDTDYSTWLMDTLNRNTFSGEIALTQLLFWARCTV